VKFIFADCLDYIDPGYDFLHDENSRGRKPYWDDQFPHEYLDTSPYDGILVSRAIVGDHMVKGKYTNSQSMRFRREGARTFLRYNGTRFADKPIFGDCGAFQYSRLPAPPYTTTDTIEFYEDGGFTHGLSIDHIIFEFNAELIGMEGGSENDRERFDITLSLAHEFIQKCRSSKASFKPIGVVQGWSPGSMAEAARTLVRMGYDYLAIGGLVPLKVQDIHIAIQSVIEATSDQVDIKLHLLGFAHADKLHEFARYSITSFDTTSPLIRAFKDDSQNYYMCQSDGSMDYYTAIRIPQAFENMILARKVRMGECSQEELCRLEVGALSALRAFDKGEVSLETTLDAIMAYSKLLLWSNKSSAASNENRINRYREYYRRTLAKKPWQHCHCRVCREAAVEVIIFRGSNRNKRRGIHNLAMYYQHVKKIRGDASAF
jgi:queuine/archaeosine tRNA-ribosyltransferase